MDKCAMLCYMEAIAVAALFALLYYIIRRIPALNLGGCTAESFSVIKKLAVKPRRRYIVLEAVGFKDELKSRRSAVKWLETSLKGIIGEIGLVNLGLTIIDYNPKNQRFIIRVYHTRVNSFMGAVGIHNSRSDVKLSILSVTGSIRKARNYLRS